MGGGVNGDPRLRTALGLYLGEEIKIRGIFEKYDAGRALITHVRNALGYPLCMHIWVKANRWFDYVELLPGMEIELIGRVTIYQRRLKGYDERVTDYGIDNPRKVRRA